MATSSLSGNFSLLRHSETQSRSLLLLGGSSVKLFRSKHEASTCHGARVAAAVPRASAPEVAVVEKGREKVRVLKLGLICGGPSAERGISLNSARSVLDHLQVHIRFGNSLRISFPFKF